LGAGIFPAPPPHPDHKTNRDGQQDKLEMVTEEISDDFDELWSELDGQ
jgi:hypothetical protein